DAIVIAIKNELSIDVDAQIQDFQNPLVEHKFVTLEMSTRVKNCLSLESAKMTKRKSCRCMHPCKQDVYTTTYSAAKWPSESNRIECDSKDCNSYYSEHAAMLEIYYEQMSYEILRESESYSIVNLVSDVGGQMGLWLGKHC
ncbi:unnamed protein product, partial [Angiostrongylus costaricensis]|uniref:Polyprotein n=1 Tax=Angiostrongylus costaricensis TaxID=334426 RepID=A0A0R3PCZ1_ANGCS